VLQQRAPQGDIPIGERGQRQPNEHDSYQRAEDIFKSPYVRYQLGIGALGEIDARGRRFFTFYFSNEICYLFPKVALLHSE